MKILAGIFAFITVLCCTGLSEASPARSVPRRLEEVTVAPVTVRHGDRSLFVAEIQQALTRGGWPTADDGIFGPVTLKTVVAFQRANGLTVDGIVGVQTRKALHLGVPAADPSPAAGTPTKPARAPSALPTKSPEACADMSSYRQAVGLPEVFDQLGFREGGCRNDSVSSNGCCVGFWQEYISSHLSSQSAYRDRIISECGVTGRGDILGNSDAQKMAQACVTKVVYDISGLSPWSL